MHTACMSQVSCAFIHCCFSACASPLCCGCLGHFPESGHRCDKNMTRTTTTRVSPMHRVGHTLQKHANAESPHAAMCSPQTRCCRSVGCLLFLEEGRNITLVTSTMTGVILFRVLYMGMLRFCRLIKAKATLPTYRRVTGMRDQARCLCTAGKYTYPLTCTHTSEHEKCRHSHRIAEILLFLRTLLHTGA